MKNENKCHYMTSIFLNNSCNPHWIAAVLQHNNLRKGQFYESIVPRVKAQTRWQAKVERWLT